MAAVLTGTPVAITWAAGANPAGQSITIPSDATAVYMFWSFYVGTIGQGLSTVTLAGSAPDEVYEVPTATGGRAATGVAIWYDPPTGSRVLDPAWDAAPEEGPTTIVAFVKDGNTSAARDIDAAAGTETAAVSVTLTTAATDLVLKYDQRYGEGDANPFGLPSLSAGWTNGQTQSAINGEYSRLSYISAAGASQACDSEIEYYSSVVAVAIPAAATGINAALAAVEKSDSCTVAVDLLVTGALVATEPRDVFAAVAKQPVSMMLAVIEQADASAISVELLVAGALAATEAKDVLAAIVARQSIVELSAVEVADSATIAADVLVLSALAAIEPADSMQAEATLLITGALAATESRDVFAATSGSAVFASMALLEPADGMAAAVSVLITGRLVATEPLDAAAIVVELVRTASMHVVEARDTLSASVARSILATLAATETSDILAAAAFQPGWIMAATEGRDVFAAVLNHTSTELEAAAFLDEYERFAKSWDAVHIVRLWYGNRVVDMPYDKYLSLSAPEQEAIRITGSGAGRVDTLHKSNA